MNYSTFSNKTDRENDTNANITQDDLVDKYYLIKKQLDDMTKCFDSTKQELYESKRNYQTALDIQQHLTAELESARGSEVKLTNYWSCKVHVLQEELVSLQNERAKTSESNEIEVENMKKIIKDLTINMKVGAKKEESKDNSTVEECIQLKTENNNLLKAIVEHKVAVQESTNVISNLRQELAVLKEELICVKSNLSGKKDELTATNEILHCTQEELATINLELQRVKTETLNHAAKGNSLFAEVDDKRQEMARSLIHMKQQNVQLKRDIVEKQAHIDGLLCEKKTLWEEYPGLASHYDAQLLECYEKHMKDLEITVEQQRQEMVRWYSKLHEPGSTQQALWLSGVLTHLKDKTMQLSDELAASRIDCLTKGMQIHELHRQVASCQLKLLEANTQLLQLQNLKNSQIDAVSNLKETEHVFSMLYKKDCGRNADVKKKVTF